MKCNYRYHLDHQIAKQIDTTQNTIKRLWELATLLALHREFGFGKERLKRFTDSLTGVYAEIMQQAAITDKYDRKHRELTNIDTAIIRVLRELRHAGIDHREILGTAEELVLIDENGKQTNLDDLLDRLE